MKSHEELKQLHGQEYVQSFKQQSPLRLVRLLKYMELDNTVSVSAGSQNRPPMGRLK